MKPALNLPVMITGSQELIVRSDSTQLLSVDGEYPGPEEIRKRKYPYVTEVYAVIRDDPDISSNAYRLYELLSAAAGQEVIRECGYVPND